MKEIDLIIKKQQKKKSSDSQFIQNHTAPYYKHLRNCMEMAQLLRKP